MDNGMFHTMSDIDKIKAMIREEEVFIEAKVMGLNDHKKRLAALKKRLEELEVTKQIVMPEVDNGKV